jgi:ribonuclease HII
MTTRLIAGVDEVGRGPLVGDVVAAAVILPAEHGIIGLQDSKKISAKKRNYLAEQIKNEALAWSIGRASAAEIDSLNILEATMLAMQRAIQNLTMTPEHVLIDGNRCPALPISCEAIVQGDGLIPCISAASIVAKVQRDEEMMILDEKFPEYGFAAHKGYPTARHLAALAEFGVTEHHRRSFKPVQRILQPIS